MGYKIMFSKLLKQTHIDRHTYMICLKVVIVWCDFLFWMFQIFHNKHKLHLTYSDGFKALVQGATWRAQTRV